MKQKTRSKNVEQQKAMQRLVRLTDNLTTAEALYNAKLHSAAHITLLSKQQFISQHGHCFPANGQTAEAQATQVYQRAIQVNRHAQFIALDALPKPYYQSSRVYNTPPSVTDFYKDMPSYQDLFGSLDYSACEDCQSVLSPSAYFVDLMRLIDTYMTQPNKDLQLQSRRADLWSMPLDCENTRREVPYLELVNSILIQAIQTYGSSSEDDSYLVLANAKYPFNLPSNFPLDSLRCYLKQSRTSLVEIYRLFNVADKQLSREMLSLSIEQYNLITTEDLDKAHLKIDYGLTTSQDLVTTLQSVPTFTQQTSITRQQLEDLICQNLSAAELKNVTIPNRFFINQDLTSDFIQTAVDSTTGAETLTNLNNDTLDKLHRFIRLADQLGWSYADLDWAWQTTTATAEYADTAKKLQIDLVVHYLARLNAFHRRYQTPIDVLCSFFADIKTVDQGNDTVSQALFDRVFNQPIAFNDFSNQGNSTPYYGDESAEKPYHPNYPADSVDPTKSDDVLANPLYGVHGNTLLIGDTPLIWTYSSDTDTNQQYRSHLLSALQVSDTDLNLILQHMSINQLIAPENTIGLDVPHLTQLYCFSQVAKLFKMPVVENILLHDMLNIDMIQRIDDLCTLEEWVDWLDASPLSIYQLHYLIYYPVAQAVSLKPNSFIRVSRRKAKTISSSQSETIFTQLLEKKFITNAGVVINKQPLTVDNLEEIWGDTFNDSLYDWIQHVLLRYYRLQYNPLNAANVSIKQVDVGYQRNAVLPLVSTLQESADAVL
ncbi:MAG: hypothetical protein JKY13_01505 [Gammaproteobacteria bacterium]|nr:hypothetical protein [Gammaproteobacteria bacterium]